MLDIITIKIIFIMSSFYGLYNSKGVLFIKTKADELYPSCRNIPCPKEEGVTLEEYKNLTPEGFINLTHYSHHFKNLNDDQINAMIFHVLYDYKDVWHCTRCWQLILDRLPSHMKGYR